MGGPGSGKTYVAKKLSSLLKIPWFDLDDIYWKRNAKSYGIKTPERLREKKFNSTKLQESRRYNHNKN